MNKGSNTENKTELCIRALCEGGACACKIGEHNVLRCHKLWMFVLVASSRAMAKVLRSSQTYNKIFLDPSAITHLIHMTHFEQFWFL